MLLLNRVFIHKLREWRSPLLYTVAAVSEVETTEREAFLSPCSYSSKRQPAARSRESNRARLVRAETPLRFPKWAGSSLQFLGDDSQNPHLAGVDTPATEEPAGGGVSPPRGHQPGDSLRNLQERLPSTLNTKTHNRVRLRPSAHA